MAVSAVPGGATTTSAWLSPGARLLLANCTASILLAPLVAVGATVVAVAWSGVVEACAVTVARTGVGGVWIGALVAVGNGLIGTIAVTTLVAVGSGVSVAGTCVGVAEGGSAVAVAGTGVGVAGSGVAVGAGGAVAVGGAVDAAGEAAAPTGDGSAVVVVFAVATGCTSRLASVLDAWAVAVKSGWESVPRVPCWRATSSRKATSKSTRTTVATSRRSTRRVNGSISRPHLLLVCKVILPSPRTTSRRLNGPKVLAAG